MGDARSRPPAGTRAVWREVYERERREARVQDRTGRKPGQDAAPAAAAEAVDHALTPSTTRLRSARRPAATARRSSTTVDVDVAQDLQDAWPSARGRLAARPTPSRNHFGDDSGRTKAVTHRPNYAPAAALKVPVGCFKC